MDDGKLKIAVLGLNEKAKVYLQVISQIDCFKIKAVADKDTQLAEKIAEEYKCNAYDDYRQLVIQNQFDCLLIPAGLHSCSEYVRMAIKKKFNILKLAPAGRNFDETAELVQLAKENGVNFGIANPGRFKKTALAMKQFLQEGKIEQISLISGIYTKKNKNHSTWQDDQELAGGGILLYDCYEIIDQIVWNFGVPKQIYSLNTNRATDKKQYKYLTEDTAVLTMKFTDNSFANLTASKAFGPQQQILSIYGKNKILTLSKNHFKVRDTSDNIIEQVSCDESEIEHIKHLLQNFSMSILSPDENKLQSTGCENLNNMAVIESAYLSARTGMPEEPEKILQISQAKMSNIWLKT